MTESSRSVRSLMMSRVRSRDTAPEIRVRKTAHALKLRFRLHSNSLPGTPDLVFPRHKVALFVHGCFWHQHKNCARASTPSSNIKFWQDKFQKNRLRDARAVEGLTRLGWRVMVIWECQTRPEHRLRALMFTAFRALRMLPPASDDIQLEEVEPTTGGFTRRRTQPGRVLS